jgi:hypothetical protein
MSCSLVARFAIFFATEAKPRSSNCSSFAKRSSNVLSSVSSVIFLAMGEV